MWLLLPTIRLVRGTRRMRRGKRDQRRQLVEGRKGAEEFDSTPRTIPKVFCRKVSGGSRTREEVRHCVWVGSALRAEIIHYLVDGKIVVFKQTAAARAKLRQDDAMTTPELRLFRCNRRRRIYSKHSIWGLITDSFRNSRGVDSVDPLPILAGRHHTVDKKRLNNGSDFRLECETLTSPARAGGDHIVGDVADSFSVGKELSAEHL